MGDWARGKRGHGEERGGEALERVLYAGAVRGDAEAVAAAVDCGGVGDAQVGRDGMTALHAAAYMRDAAMLGMLLEAGANPNVRDVDGVTPMMACASNLEMSRMLLAAGADPDARDSMGRTAVDWARASASRVVGGRAGPTGGRRMI